MGRRHARLAAGALALTVALGGCTSQAEEPRGEPEATTHVDMPRSYRFKPEAIEVEAGTTVTWTNSDNFTHDVVLLEPKETPLGLVEPSEEVTHTFEEPGTYHYHCSLHPQQMQGVVHVTGKT